VPQQRKQQNEDTAAEHTRHSIYVFIRVIRVIRG
jgi:hypothetical protein